jgi:hypothetical protein
MKTKTRPRARRMWANYYPSGAIAFHKKRSTAKRFRGFRACPTVAVAVIPLHNVEQIVLEALYAWGNHKGEDTASSMRAALTAIGVLPKAKKGRK